MRYNKPQGRYSINKKKTYYSQFNTLATRWASKAEKGELFAGYDGNNYKIVIATGDDYLYENYKTVDANNDALIEYYEEFIKENNEKIRSHRNANSVFESIEEFDAVKGRNNRYSLDVARRQPNDRDGGIYQEQSQRNGERNTEEGSRNQRGLKGGRASLAVDSAGNALTAEQAEYFKDSKVRDEDGNLMVVYHGTMEDFTVFDIKKARSYDETLDYDLPAFYFSQSTEEGGSYGKAKPYYVNIKNPYNGDLWALKKEYGTWRKVYDYLVEQGYDGVIYDDLGDGYNEYLAFHPNQIKLTTNKAPTKKADIRYSLNVDLAKKTSDRVQTIVRDKGVVRQTISDIREGKKSVKETWDEILEELKYGERARWIEILKKMGTY